MQKLTSPPQAGVVLGCAFESCCAVLRSLEIASVQAAQDADDDRQRHLRCAIKLVQEAISELRSIRERELTALAAGFVLAGEEPSANGQPPDER